MIFAIIAFVLAVLAKFFFEREDKLHRRTLVAPLLLIAAGVIGEISLLLDALQLPGGIPKAELIWGTIIYILCAFCGVIGITLRKKAHQLAVQNGKMGGSGPRA